MGEILASEYSPSWAKSLYPKTEKLLWLVWKVLRINCSGDNQHVTMQRNENRESGEFYFQALHGVLALPVVEMLQKKPICD